MRATAHSRVEVNPFEIMFGRQMRINAPVEPEMVLPFSGEKRRYYYCLAKEMKRLHQAVKDRKETIKLQDKAEYHRANRVATPQWQIGQKVWLHDTRVPPGSNTIIIRNRYHGLYIVQDIAKGDPKIGAAYKLVRESDGRPLKYLVNSDRLKKCNIDRTEFDKRLPRLFIKTTGPMKVGTPDNSATEAKRLQKMNRRGRNKTDLDDGYEEASEIVGEKWSEEKNSISYDF